MKVAFFYFLKFGGAKRVVMDQVRGFKENGNKVDVYTINSEKDFFDPSKYATNFKNFHFSTKYLNIPIIGKLFYFYYILISLKSLQKKIASEIDSKKYDVVIIHPDTYIQAPYLLRFLNTFSVYYTQEPYRIAHEHGMRIKDFLPLYIRLYEHIKRYIVKIEDRRNVRCAKKIVASSYSVRERMIHAYDVYPYVSSPGINVDVFKSHGYKKNKNLLFVGSKNDPTDGYDLLENALMHIPKSARPELKFVAWKKKNNERLTEKELAKIYETSWATMCMSRFETFGLIPLESMGCGTPVIATNIGGHRETILNGKTGFLVDPDPVLIAKKIQLVLTMKNYANFCRNAEKHVRKNWSINKKNNEFIRLIIKFVKNG